MRALLGRGARARAAVVVKPSLRWYTLTRRLRGGYIEESNLVQMGQEIYEDLHGLGAQVPADFIVPQTDDWPTNLWDYELGQAQLKGSAAWHRPSWVKNAQTVKGRSNSLSSEPLPRRTQPSHTKPAS